MVILLFHLLHGHALLIHLAYPQELHVIHGDIKAEAGLAVLGLTCSGR